MGRPAASLIPGDSFEPASLNSLIANASAIAIALWMRLSIETYPGIRSSYVIFPAALTGHGLVIALLPAHPLAL